MSDTVLLVIGAFVSVQFTVVMLSVVNKDNPTVQDRLVAIEAALIKLASVITDLSAKPPDIKPPNPN
jgi:multisubunit Na+/H+ antiporter MnhF subunit